MTKQEIKSIVIMLSVIAAPFCIYYGWQAYKLDRYVAKLEQAVITPKTDENSVSEIGYIWDTKVKYQFSQEKKLIIWWIKIPATNALYSCEYLGGYLDFRKDEAVQLIRQTNTDSSSDYTGYVVGLHLKNKGKIAQVWALDVAELELLLDN